MKTGGIATATDFKAFIDAVTSGSSLRKFKDTEGNVILLNDIDMKDITLTSGAGSNVTSNTTNANTKVVYTISFDRIQKEYTDKVKEGVETGTFSVYLKAEVDRLISYESSFDGIIAEYKGKKYLFICLRLIRKRPRRIRIIFWGAVMAWKQANTNKLLTFQGYPENLIGQSVLSECRHIILATDDVDAVEELSVVARKAMLSAGTPTDRFVVAVSTISMDAADTKTGFYEKARAIKEAAYWITEPSADYTRAGIAIYNIQNDYYNADAIYPCVKEAINIMNPSPRK